MELSVNIGKIVFEVEFQYYLDYMKFMEEFLEEEKKKEDKNIEKALSEISSGDSEIAIMFLPKIFEFADMLRKSFFVTLYSFFESKLVQECRLRKNNEIALTFDDIRAPDDIERVKKYFTKVLRSDFPSNSPEWETIQNYRVVRNCIVHAQGRIDELKDKKDREKLQRFVNKNGMISLSRNEEDQIAFFRNNGEIYIHRGFCEDACKTIGSFLIMVFFPDQEEG